MTENLKTIVQAVNRCLKTDFNLISFDSQSEESLLQVLLDVFHKFEIIGGRVRHSDRICLFIYFASHKITQNIFQFLSGSLKRPIPKKPTKR